MKELYDILMDEANVDPIVLGDADGNDYTYEQLAVLECEGEDYAILIDEDEETEETNAVFLKLLHDVKDVEEVDDEELMDKIIEVYEALVEEEADAE